MDNRISVVINTLNEERDLPNALASVKPWADQIIVVDMHSTDRTVEIARQFGAAVLLHERTGYTEPARTLGVEKADGPWILVLDADEMVPLPLARRIREITAADEADVFAVPRLNHQFGRPLLHARKGPHQERPHRLFKKGFLDISPRIHFGLVKRPEARFKALDYAPGLALVHFEFRDLDELIEKYNRYSGVEAMQNLRRGDKPRRRDVLTAPLYEFWRRYVKGAGFRAGWRGLTFCLFKAFYRLAVRAKMLTLQEAGDHDAVDREYARIARDVLDEYGAPAR